jgi:hypothetical protein
VIREAAISDSIRRRTRILLLGLLAVLCLGALVASSANAEYTNPFLGKITLASGTNPQPVGVDPQGNIIVYLEGQEVLEKFDPSGNPVNFSALGTNVLDGQGGLECPQVPGDCDRVPAGELGPFFNDRPIAAVDESGGPTNGYIYVRNHNRNTLTGELCVFAPTGRFLGTINEAKAAPIATPDLPPESISVAPDGSIYTTRGAEEELGSAPNGGQVDMYFPVDGNPANDEFVGQLRFAFQYHVKQVNFTPEYVIGAGQEGAFAHGGAGGPTIGPWRYYSIHDFQRPDALYTQGTDYLPFDKDQDYNQYSRGSVNPNNNWIYLINGAGIALYGQDRHHKIGPTIATEGEIAGSAYSIAFDHSGGADTGRFYVKGGEHELSIFGPPVVIPDVEATSSEAGHHEATVHAQIGLAGGPPVSECIVEYGLTNTYGSEVPCSPAPTYSGDQEVSGSLPGLFTEADYHYRVKATNANGWNHTFDNIVHTVAVLKAQTGDVTNLTSTSATFNGSLDPDGMATTYRFQYGLDTNYDLETESSSAGSGTGPVTLSPIDVAKLQPGRTYHYRLVAENSLGTTFAQDRTFTVPARPLISGLNPTNILGTTVDLSAQINDYNLPAEYFFEYGETSQYGSNTATEALPASPSAQSVTVHVEGLDPAATYHFRLVAMNELGTSRSSDAQFDYGPPGCPNSHVRQQVGANYLPDCRAYELVSPTRAGSIQFFPGDFLHRLSPTFLTSEGLAPRYENSGYEESPPRFGFYGGLGGLEGIESPDFIFDHYLATRTSQGWETHYPGQRSDETGVALHGECSITGNKCLDYRVDISKITSVDKMPFPYLWDAEGHFLTRLPTNYAVVPNADHLTGEQVPSPDFSHFVFSSLDVPFKPGGLEEAPGSVYDNDIDHGTVEIASQLQGGAPIPRDQGTTEDFINIPAISNDGTHILMSTIGSGGGVNLYMRVDGAVTYDVSKGNSVTLIGMSSDGSKVVFISPNALTPEDEDSSRDVYIWEEATDQVRLVSTGGGEGQSDDCHASWTTGCDVQLLSSERPDIDDKMSADGDVYFLSPEQLDPENPGVRNQRNLYHLRNGQVQYVTTLDPGTTIKRVQMSADGQHAAFVTSAQLTGYDNAYYNRDGELKNAAEMYVFDAATGEIQCASCDPTGAPPTILRLEPPGNEENRSTADVMASLSGRFISDDGRVAFSTSDALSPRDTDGKVDTYEFVGGRPQLISGGTGDRDELPTLLETLFPGQFIGFESISRDGKDLYFSTFETLVPQDENGPFVKFYDARTGGGFQVAGQLLPCEAADECHGETSRPPANPQVGTGTPFTAPGNVANGAQKKQGKHVKHRKRKRKRHGRHQNRRGHRHVQSGGRS